MPGKNGLKLVLETNRPLPNVQFQNRHSIITSSMSENFSICQLVEAPRAAFVAFWARQYEDDLENLYDANIHVKPFTDDAIRKLFEWKNGSKLSDRKEKSVERNFISKKDHESVKRAIDFPSVASLEEARTFASQFLAEDFPEGGEIWRIFWLHCCNQRFPIYDQHVHRAMVFIEEGRIEDLERFAERKIDQYLRRYLPFYRRFEENERDVDKALHTFGRLLQMWPGLIPTT